VTPLADRVDPPRRLGVVVTIAPAPGLPACGRRSEGLSSPLSQPLHRRGSNMNDARPSDSLEQPGGHFEQAVSLREHLVHARHRQADAMLHLNAAAELATQLEARIAEAISQVVADDPAEDWLPVPGGEDDDLRGSGDGLGAS
jgi:hypothetical protein